MSRSSSVGYELLTFLLPSSCRLTSAQIPIGPWTKDPALKELGRYELIHMQMSVESHTPALFTRVWNYSTQQVQVLMEGVKREFRNPNLRLITSYRFIYGQNPIP